jgi:ribonuclease BN (tRNA processing enzyme)
MKVVPLGINGFVPTFGRHTTSFLLLTDKTAILLDAGTGVARLFESHLVNLLSPYAELNIILSHYHLDHIIGLSYLPGILCRRSVTIYAPAPPLIESNPADSIQKLLRPPFFSLSLEQFPMGVRVVPITKLQFQVAELSVSVRVQTHPGGSIGIRLGEVVFMTDTIVDENAIPFTRAAELLLHEVWLEDDDIRGNESDLAGHSYAGGVVNMALNAGVRRLMPIHLHPTKTAHEIERLAKTMSRDALQVTLPAEGRVYELGGGL